MRTSATKTFFSCSLLLFTGFLVCFPLYHAQAVVATAFECVSTGSAVHGKRFDTFAACQADCYNAMTSSQGRCLEIDLPPDSSPTPVVTPTPTITPPTGIPPEPPQSFVPLTKLPGLSDDTGKRTLADYLNVLFRLAIGIGALIAVIKITVAGIKYMAQDSSFSSKEEAKKDITSALLGLLIMLSTVVILTLIYPDILNLNVLKELKPVQVINSQQLPGTTPVPTEVQTTLATTAAENGETVLLSRDYPITDAKTSALGAGVAAIEFRKACEAFTPPGRTVITNVGTIMRMVCYGKAPASSAPPPPDTPPM